MLTILAVLALSAGPMAVAQHRPEHPHVRSEQPELRALIDAGIRRSNTLAALVAALNASDVIVFIEARMKMPARVHGYLAHTVITIGDLRGLRIAVSSLLYPDYCLSVIAHELYHALEVAEAADVRSDAAITKFYERMDWSKCRLGLCETGDASRVQELVLRELATRPR